MSIIQRRRKELLAKFGRNQEESQVNNSFNDKLNKEISRLLKCVAGVQHNVNPMSWFKENEKDFPILSRFWLAYSSFPATSCSAERVFNNDGLIVTDLRYAIIAITLKTCFFCCLCYRYFLVEIVCTTQ